jgi:hypothetical protein
MPQVLRETGCLNGVLTTDGAKSDDELVAMTKNWSIVGQDLLKVVSRPRGGPAPACVRAGMLPLLAALACCVPCAPSHACMHAPCRRRLPSAALRAP